MNNQPAGDGILLVLTSRTTVGGLQLRFAAIAEHVFEHTRLSGRLLAHEHVLDEFRKMGFALPAQSVAAIPNNILLRGQVGASLWILAHVLRRRYRHVHLASNPSPLSWLFALLARVLPPFSVSAVDPRVNHANRWLRGLRHAASIDCLSTSIAAKIVERQPSLASHIRVAPSSFPARPLRRHPDVLGEATERDIDLLFVSRFVPGKGIELLNAIGPDLANLRVRIAGLGPYQPRVPGAVVGPEADIPPLFARSKIFLSLQLETNYPSQAIYEAVQAGCAVVSVDSGDTRRFLSEESAVLVPPQPRVIVAAVRQLLADPERITTLAAQAAYDLRRHTVEAYTDYFLGEVVA